MISLSMPGYSSAVSAQVSSLSHISEVPFAISSDMFVGSWNWGLDFFKRASRYLLARAFIRAILITFLDQESINECVIRNKE